MPSSFGDLSRVFGARRAAARDSALPPPAPWVGPPDARGLPVEPGEIYGADLDRANRRHVGPLRVIGASKIPGCVLVMDRKRRTFDAIAAKLVPAGAIGVANA